MSNSETRPTFGSSSYTSATTIAAQRLRFSSPRPSHPASRVVRARLGRGPVPLGDRYSAAAASTTLLHGGCRRRGDDRLDDSPRFLARAWRQGSRGVAFGEHDITRVPFPTPPCRSIYCATSSVTHLVEASTASRTLSARGVGRARRALEEVDTMRRTMLTLIRCPSWSRRCGRTRPRTYVVATISGARARRDVCAGAGRHRTGGAPDGRRRAAARSTSAWRQNSVHRRQRRAGGLIASATPWTRWRHGARRPRQCAGEWRGSSSANAEARGIASSRRRAPSHQGGRRRRLRTLRFERDDDLGLHQLRDEAAVVRLW